VALALPFVVWAAGVPWWLSLVPNLPPWPLHLTHTAVMCLALLAAAFGVAWLLARRRGSARTGLLPRPYAAGALVLGALLATIYGSEALYEGDWHQWSTVLRPGDAVQQTFVLPANWRPPAGGRAEVRLYLAGSPAPSYEPVLSADGQLVARLGPGLSETGPLRFWEKIMVAARNQGKTRPEVAQWVAFPLDLTTLSKPELTVELSVVPAPDAAPEAPEGALRIWGDYAPRTGVRLYEGPPAYSRIQGQDEAFLKYIATGEYGIWRWQPLQSVATRATRHLAASRSDAAAWRGDDLSDAPGRQLGEYRMRIVVYAANGDLAALF
jgi:hypothetical protein